MMLSTFDENKIYIDTVNVIPQRIGLLYTIPTNGGAANERIYHVSFHLKSFII